MKPYKKFIFATAILLASSPLFAMDKDEQLEKQLSSYWAAQAKQDWSGLYDLLPKEQQAKSSRSQYVDILKQSHYFDIVNPQVKDLQIVNNQAWAGILYGAKVLKFPKAPIRYVSLWQLWLKTDTWHPATKEEAQQYCPLPPKLRSIADETTLSGRAKAAWAAKSAQDWKTFYSFLSPAYREKVSLDNYLKKKAQYLYPTSEVKWVQVANNNLNVGTVRIDFSIKPNDSAVSKLEAQQRNVIEDWVKVGSEWYYNIKLPVDPTKAAPKATPNEIKIPTGTK